MSWMFAAIALLMGGALQARWLQQQPPPGVPAQASGPLPTDAPHSRDTFGQDPRARPSVGGPARKPNIASLPRLGVSARTLAHKYSNAAVQAFSRGVRAWNKGESDQALYNLGEAVRLDPDFVEARAELGVVYVKTRRPEEALSQLEQALAIEPNWAVLQSNKASVLVMLSRWEEAERSARRAVQLDPKLIEANYMLGIAMMMQGKITAETAERLALAAKKYPNARAFLAEVQAKLAAEPRK